MYAPLANRGARTREGIAVAVNETDHVRLPCLVGIEACAHHWSREIAAVGHTARLMPPALGAQLSMLRAQILELDRQIMAWHRSNGTSQRLDQIPCVGPALATALVASVPDPKAFRSGRPFFAWIGLVPRQHSREGFPYTIIKVWTCLLDHPIR
jgi:transposase